MTINIAVFTATLKDDYDWYSSDNSFKNDARELRSCWHNEIYDGAWFGLMTQNGKTFFLAGKVPTKRRDGSNRNILDYIVLQSQTPEDSKQLALLMSDLLKKRQDISDVDSPFTQWLDNISVAMAEKGSYDYTPFPTMDATLSSESGASIGRFEYPLNSQTDRTNVANALSSLLESGKDFLVGCIQYPVEKFSDKLNKAGYDLSNAQIAVFSARTDSKKELKGTDPFPPPRIPGGTSWTTSNNVLKNIFNPLSIGLLMLLIVASTLFLLWHQNAKKANLIQNLTSQVQDLATQNQNLTNQVAKMEKTITGYTNDILKKDSEIKKWIEDYNNLQDNFKNTLAAKNLEIQQTTQRYEAELKAQNAEIEKLKQQINSPKELPPPPATPADSNPVNPVNSDSVVE